MTTKTNTLRKDVARLEEELENLLGEDIELDVEIPSVDEVQEAKRLRAEHNEGWKPQADLLPRTIDNLFGVEEESRKLVEEELQQGRRHFGVPAANIASSDFEDTRDRAGAAEALTSQHILNWMESRKINNAVLVDSVNVNGFHDDKDTDHLLILGSTVLVIDTKAFATGYHYKLKDRSGRGGGGAELLRSEMIDGEIVPNPRSYKHHCYLSTDALLGIWRRYLLPQANVFGMIYINSDDTRVQRNREWFDVPFPIVDRETVYSYLDRLYDHVKRETHLDGTPAGEMLNAELIAQAVVAATAGEGVDAESVIEKARDKEQLANGVDSVFKVAEDEHADYWNSSHYHVSNNGWTISDCDDDNCERRSFKLDEAIKMVNCVGELTYGVGDDYWFKMNQFLFNEDGTYAGGASADRGKYRFNIFEDLTLHLLTGRIGNDAYLRMLKNMVKYNKNVVPAHLEEGEETLEKRNKALQREYKAKDRLSPDPDSELPQTPVNSLSRLYKQWDGVLNEIVLTSEDKLTAEGKKWKKYEAERPNRYQTEARKKNIKNRR